MHHHAPTIQQLFPPLVSDITNAGVIAGAILTLLFLVQYTYRTKFGWRYNAAGRAIVALDACLAIILIPGAIKRMDESFQLGVWDDWLTAISLCLVCLVVLYRIVSLEIGAHRKMLERRMKAGEFVDKKEGDE